MKWGEVDERSEVVYLCRHQQRGAALLTSLLSSAVGVLDKYYCLL